MDGGADSRSGRKSGQNKRKMKGNISNQRRGRRRRKKQKKKKRNEGGKGRVAEGHEKKKIETIL